MGVGFGPILEVIFVVEAPVLLWVLVESALLLNLGDPTLNVEVRAWTVVFHWPLLPVPSVLPVLISPVVGLVPMLLGFRLHEVIAYTRLWLDHKRRTSGHLRRGGLLLWRTGAS